MATSIIPRPKQLKLVRKDRVEAEALLATLVRHLARKEIKAEWKRQGRQITYADATALANETSAHLGEHGARLRTEALAILSSEQ
jgi:acyl-CoA synthetase (AMP-forming)/AMP-acid ligase II